jgi:RNA polymerase sigma-70 factor (ECF subfamily)
MSPSDPHQLVVLFEQSRTGNLEALNTLLGRLRPYLQAQVRVWLGHDLARRLADSDVVQEVLLRASRHFTDFRGERVPQLLAWLKTITYRVTCERRNAFLASVGRVGPLPAEAPAGGPDPADVLEGEEDAIRLAEALERLSPRRREVIELRLLEGLSFDEMAGRLGGSPGSLRVLFLRAVRHLRLLLEGQP